MTYCNHAKIIKLLIFLHKVQNRGLGAGAAEDGGDVGDGADLGLLVAVLAWDDGLLVRKLLGENDLETFLYPHVSQPFTNYIGKGAVEGF